MGSTTRGLIIILLAIGTSFDSAWRMLTFNYNFVPVNFDILPHFILLDFIPLYFLIAITWLTKKREVAKVINL